MADWGQRPKDKDRDRAIAQIEAAAARGQIVDADKAKRIQEVKAAGSVGEIDLITRGLAAPAAAAATPVAAGPPPVSDPAPPVSPTFTQYTPPTVPPVTEPDLSPGPPPTTVQYGEALTPSSGTPIATPPMVKKSGRGGVLVLVILLIVIAGIAVPAFIGIKALVDTVSDGIDDIGVGGDADVFSAEGLDELADALEEETGSTQIFDATLYPGYAYLQVPAEASGQRMLRYYWDGDLEMQSKGRSTYPQRMDLRDIKADVVEDLRAKIRRKVEDALPDTNYVIAHAPGPTDEGAYLYAYATNDFSEGGYVAATLDGKVIRTTTW